MQAARGTSLSPQDSTVRPPTPRGASRWRLRGLFVAIALMLYVADLGTKILAVDKLTGRADAPLVGDLLVLHLTRNPGAAFSTGTQYTVVLTGIAMVAVLVVLWLSRRLGSAVWAVALGLLLAGVSGNLTDRIFRDPSPLRGHVIDFLMLPNWPVFNIADICINVAAGLILLQAFRGIRIDGARSHPDAESDTGPKTGPNTGSSTGPDSGQEKEQ